ncbi:MAG: EamA-like transporter family protein [Chitinophagaceae bacterium]|nr:EamA-like transporter family protein [Chitinophagaceae bacterium]
MKDYRVVFYLSGMNNNAIYILLAFFTGALIPVQAATNTAFGKTVGSPFITGIMVFIVALILTSAYLLITRTPLPSLAQLSKAPAFSYAGGLVMASYVIMITFVAPKLGVGNAIALVVTGQIFSALLIDQFGLFHSTIRTINLTRLAGAVMMIAGVYLVMKRK